MGRTTLDQLNRAAVAVLTPELYRATNDLSYAEREQPGSLEWNSDFGQTKLRT